MVKMLDWCIREEFHVLNCLKVLSEDAVSPSLVGHGVSKIEH